MTQEINYNISMEEKKIKATINYDHSLKEEILTTNVLKKFKYSNNFNIN